MEITTLKITKQDLEKAVPAATSKNEQVLSMLAPGIEHAFYMLKSRMLGPVGYAALTDDAHADLLRLCKWHVCQQAFCDNFRSLDLVLTGTGFGVVSTQDLAPASKVRVDALKAQQDKALLLTTGTLLDELFNVQGWGAQPLRRLLVPTLFHRFDMLESLCGMSQASAADWYAMQPTIREADRLLRDIISEEQMDVLLDAVTGSLGSGLLLKAVDLCRLFTAFHVSGKLQGKRQTAMQLVNLLESDLDTFKAYAGSSVYKANHIEKYENTKESPVFFFQGWGA